MGDSSSSGDSLRATTEKLARIAEQVIARYNRGEISKKEAAMELGNIQYTADQAARKGR